MRGEHLKIVFLVGIKWINSGLLTFDLRHFFYKPVRFFVCLGFSTPMPWCFMSFCCFFGFSLSSILSHSRLQSKEFFLMGVLLRLLSLNDASPGGLGHLFPLNFSNRGTFQTRPCQCLHHLPCCALHSSVKPVHSQGTGLSYQSLCKGHKPSLIKIKPGCLTTNTNTIYLVGFFCWQVLI